MVARRGRNLVFHTKEKQEECLSSDGFHKGSFRPFQHHKSDGKDHHQNKGRGKDQKVKKAKKEFSFHPDSQPQKHPTKKDMARPGNLPVTGPMIPGLRMLGGSAQKLILDGWWQHR